MATIEDVAKRAGVSVATVSRVINGTGVVSAKRAESVRSAVEELDFRPNASGRNLRRGETKTLLVICSVAINEVLNGIYDAAKGLGYRVIVNYISRSREQATSYFDEFFTGNVDGALLFGPFYDGTELTKIARRIPMVQCCGYLDIPNAFRVSIDEEKASYDITRHLIDQGRRRIGLITLDMPGITEGFFIKREQGYRRALAESGIPYDPSIVKKCTTGYHNGYEIGKSFVEMEQKVDALFSVQDIMAYGALQAILDAGLSVPGDIAVAGFDDIEIAQLSRPPITTISQPFYELGSVAARMLVSLIKGEVTTGEDLYLPHELIVRGSTVP